MPGFQARIPGCRLRSALKFRKLCIQFFKFGQTISLLLPFILYHGVGSILYESGVGKLFFNSCKEALEPVNLFLQAFSFLIEIDQPLKGDKDFSSVNHRSCRGFWLDRGDRKSTRLNSSHVAISYAVFCLKKK